MTDTPTNVTSLRTGNCTAKLSWSAPVNTTPPVAGYEVFYAVSGSDVAQSGGTTTYTTTTITMTLPTLDVVYDIFVVAFSDVENALPSERSSNSTISLTKLGMFVMKTFSIYLVFVARWP